MLIKYLDWDSKFFGLNIGSCQPGVFSEENQKIFWEEFSKKDFDCAYLFFSHEDKKGADLAFKFGGLYVGEQVVYEMRREDWKGDSSDGKSAVLGKISEAEDIQLLSLARKLSETSRFFMDPKFRSFAAKMYEIWFEKLKNGKDSIIVAAFDEEKKIIGFIGCSITGNVGKMDLVVVSENCRGKGIGKSMMRKAMSSLFAKGVEKIIIVTQAENEAANKLYQWADFKLNLSENKKIYHLWRK
ncbi:MAG: GNAT family N-acetyltransferase [Candidatus Pacebacteria bacterium]|nr:GNAT family N-acetyltransferase [Candidatus Paceibacterota bacterium]